MPLIKSRIASVLFLLISMSAWGQGDQHVKKIVRILDEKGRETAARVRVTQNDSIYFAPDGHRTDFPFTNFGGDVILDNNRRFAYIDGQFSIQLPTASVIRIEIVKGFAYKIY